MKDLKISKNPAVKAKFQDYPKHIRPKLDFLRELIIEVAKEDADITEIEETLKWGEPSYLVKKGSTVRMDWKAKKPEQYALYFKCTSKLVETFKQIHSDTFAFEGNRAIIFKLDDAVPEIALKQCVAMALNYHKVKHLPRLGA